MECKTAPKRDIFCHVSIWGINKNIKADLDEIMSNLRLAHYEVVNELLLLQWSDDIENALPLKGLRNNCPCASCIGEKDVFGTVYKSPPQNLTESSYILNGIKPVGYYALQPFWDDGHHTGIYSFELLRKLCDELDQ